MRSLMTLSTLVFVAAPAPAQRDRYEQRDRYDKRAVAYARRLSVSQLDRSLNDQSFGEWLRRIVGPHAKITWEANDCGEQIGAPSDAARDIPSCVEARAQLPDRHEVVITIAVGTFNKGISGPPSVYDAFVRKNAATIHLRKLGELANALNQSAR